jgi:hypothetical protein
MAVTGKHNLRVSLALAGLLALLAGGAPAAAQNLVLSTNKGCGSGAVFQPGELVRISFGSDRLVTASLTLSRPDGTTQLLFSGTLQGGVTRAINGIAGSPNGTRTLNLTAGLASTRCAFSVGGSSGPSPSPEARVLGIFDLQQDTVTVPATVRAGQEFPVTITTFGGGCERKGDEGVILSENGATMMVYDFTTATRPGVPCTTILNRFTHTVTLRFTQPGQALIQVWGRRVGPDTPLAGVPIVIERRVTVQ